MYVIGLTGSIGMGKSTASAMLKRMGLPVFDADASVHRMLEDDPNIISTITESFPEHKNADGLVDVKSLARSIFFDAAAIAKLESILHPVVLKEMQEFIKHQSLSKASRVVLDVPLLFEAGWDKYCDSVILIHAPAAEQKKRVLSREGMTIEKFSAIKRRQMPEAEKLKKADYVVTSAMGLRHTRLRLAAVLEDLCVK